MSDYYQVHCIAYVFLIRRNEIFAMYIRLALAIDPSIRSWSLLFVL